MKKIFLVSVFVGIAVAGLVYGSASVKVNNLPISGGIPAGVSGSILFVNSANQLAQDNSNLYWNDTNNRLGVGTTSPVADFGIAGSLGVRANHLVLSAGGNVGIGTTSPATALDVNGTITQLTVKSCTLGLTTDALGSITGCVASDIKLKTEINPFKTSMFEIIDKLNPVFYQFKDTLGINRAGFIAQEVEKVFPEAVVPAGENLKGVDPNAINALLVKSIQELKLKNDELEKRILILESK